MISLIYFYLFSLLAPGFAMNKPEKEIVKSIYFESNKFTIDKKQKQQLNEIVQRDGLDTLIYLRIYAYADTVGSVKNNSVLSEKRANAVYKYLIRATNLDTTKVYITWLGEETDAAYDLHFPQAHFQQRCVDVIAGFRR